MFLKLAVDGYVGILIETAVGFETRFGFGTAFDNREIMIKEPDFPLKGFGSVGMFQGVGLALGEFDEFAIRYTGSRPSLGEMVGVELEDATMARVMADDDMLLVVCAFLERIHLAPEVFDALHRHEIAHSPGMGSGNVRVRGVVRYNALQTVFDDRFQMSRHVV